MHDARLVRREREPSGGEPGMEHLHDRTSIVLGFAENAEVVGVTDDGARPRDAAGFAAADTERVFQAVQRYIR